MPEGEEDYDCCQESGPFCRHWRDLNDCDEVCQNCGHRCTDHDVYGICRGTDKDCLCMEFEDKEKKP